MKIIVFLLYIAHSNQELILPSKKDLTIRALDYLYGESQIVIDRLNKNPPIRSKLITRRPLELGSFCVYHSECSGCDVGYSQRCLSNRCQCLPVGFSAKNGFMSHLLDCIVTQDKKEGISQLVYYDSGIHSCMVDYLKNSTKTDFCDYHYKLKSLADGRIYCLNAIDPFDMVCTENRMCQEAIDNKEFVGFCINGICHAMSTNNYEETIKSIEDCASGFTEYCLERNYTYVEATQKRQMFCSNRCLELTNVSGIAASYRDTCQCFHPVHTTPDLF